jgi:hypothetical protein
MTNSADEGGTFPFGIGEVIGLFYPSARSDTVRHSANRVRAVKRPKLIAQLGEADVLGVYRRFFTFILSITLLRHRGSAQISGGDALAITECHPKR